MCREILARSNYFQQSHVWLSSQAEVWLCALTSLAQCLGIMNATEIVKLPPPPAAQGWCLDLTPQQRDFNILTVEGSDTKLSFCKESASTVRLYFSFLFLFLSAQFINFICIRSFTICYDLLISLIKLSSLRKLEDRKNWEKWTQIIITFDFNCIKFM